MHFFNPLLDYLGNYFICLYSTSVWLDGQTDALADQNSQFYGQKWEKTRIKIKVSVWRFISVCLTCNIDWKMFNFFLIGLKFYKTIMLVNKDLIGNKYGPKEFVKKFKNL